MGRNYIVGLLCPSPPTDRVLLLLPLSLRRHVHRPDRRRRAMREIGVIVSGIVPRNEPRSFTDCAACFRRAQGARFRYLHRWELLEGAHTLPRIEPPLWARYDPRERSSVHRGHRVTFRSSVAKFVEIVEISGSCVQNVCQLKFLIDNFNSVDLISRKRCETRTRYFAGSRAISC
jgi:hypothetical protein